MNNVLADFWAACGMNGPVPEASVFGDTPALQDELCALIISGQKCATASLAGWYDADAAPLPRVGDLRIILDGVGTPRGIIEITSVEETPFHAVTAEFAAAEGEGDRSLAYWRAEHLRYFESEQAKDGLDFCETDLVILERFKRL